MNTLAFFVVLAAVVTVAAVFNSMIVLAIAAVPLLVWHVILIIRETSP